MSIYFWILGILLIILLNRNNKFIYYYRKIFVSIILILLFIVCVFRASSVGTDYKQYYILFTQYSFPELVEDYVKPGIMELGYIRLTGFAQYMNNFLIIPSTVVIVVFIAIYLLGKEFRVNQYTLISIFVMSGLYFQMFTALRQMIALGIAYIGLFLLFKFSKHKIMGLLLLLLLIYIAMTFHETAIFVFIFMFLPYIKYGKITVIISCVLTITLLLTGVAQDLSLFLIKITPHYSEKYTGFSMSNYGSFKDLLIESIPIILQYIFLYIFISHNSIVNRKEQFILSGYLLYLIMFTGLNNNSIRRLQLYTLIFPILFSCIFLDGKYNYKSKIRNMINGRGIKIVYILTWVSLYIGKLLITDRFGIVPYRLINLMKIYYY